MVSVPDLVRRFCLVTHMEHMDSHFLNQQSNPYIEVEFQCQFLYKNNQHLGENMKSHVHILSIHSKKKKKWDFITLKITVPKRPQIRLPPPPLPQKMTIFWGRGKLFLWEEFNFELGNFYPGEGHFGISRTWDPTGWPITLIRPALLGCKLLFLPIWGIFYSHFLRSWSYWTCAAKMTIPSGI